MYSRNCLIASLICLAAAGCEPMPEMRVCERAGQCGAEQFCYLPDADGDGICLSCEHGEAMCADGDGDGFSGELDCDDNDAETHPTAVEVCNGLDDDCDGLIDDEDPDLREGGIWCLDADGDGFGASDVGPVPGQCAAPDAGYVADCSDLDDTDATVHPDAPELCDGLDNDQDGMIDEEMMQWFADADNDGSGNPAVWVEQCEAPMGYVDNGDDCNDNLAAVHPGAAESCNGLDDDCDGLIDDADDLTPHDAPTWYFDYDGDTCGSMTLFTRACQAPSGYVAVGNDCDDNDAGVCQQGDHTYYRDVDGDGFGDPNDTVEGCVKPPGYVLIGGDCNDNDSAIHPAAAEVCDGVDNNCDGQTDNVDADGDGEIDDACGGNDCDDTDPSVPRRYFRDVDNDSHGTIDVTVYRCVAPMGYVDQDGDCDDNDPDIRPGANEVCDGIDNDCDGDIDQADDDLDQSTLAIWCADNDGDGYGDCTNWQYACYAPNGYTDLGGDCNDSEAAQHPAATEVCADGVDNDCDGQVDGPGCLNTHVGVISADEFWAADEVHLVTGLLRVEGASSPTLTIEDGAIVRFQPGANLYVGWQAPGRLLVEGTTSNGVRFTSNQPVPAAGDWGQVNIYSRDTGSILSGLTVEYGGRAVSCQLDLRSISVRVEDSIIRHGLSNGVCTNHDASILDRTEISSNHGQGLHAYNSDAFLDSVVIRDNHSHGVYATERSNLSIENSTIENNDGNGVQFSYSYVTYTGAGSGFKSNTIANNNGYPLIVHASSLGEVDSDNQFLNNLHASVRVDGDGVYQNARWQNLGLPLHIFGNVATGHGALLEIEGGTVLEFAPGSYLRSNIGYGGNITIFNKAAGDVVFKAIDASQRWAGLRLHSCSPSQTILDGVTIMQAELAVYWNSCSGSLIDSTLVDNDVDMECINSSPVITNTDISGTITTTVGCPTPPAP